MSRYVRTVPELVELATQLPTDQPFGMTWMECQQFGGVRLDVPTVLMGRRVVIIPGDWKTNPACQ
jgi:hypothetical protein